MADLTQYLGHQTDASGSKYIKQEQELLKEIEQAAVLAETAAANALASAQEAKKYAAYAETVANWSQVVDDDSNKPADNADVTTSQTKVNTTGWDDIALSFAANIDLKIKNNVTNPNYQVDIDATSVTLVDSGGDAIKVSAVNLTTDITSSGANGLDTGSEGSSTWYHLFVIYNGSTIAGLLSTSATAPTMPSGYTFKGYVGAIYNNSSSNFITMTQIGRIVYTASNAEVVAGTATSFTSFTIQVPSTAKKWKGLYQIVLNGSGNGQIWLSADSSGSFFNSMKITLGNASQIILETTSIVIETAQTLYYKIASASQGDVTTLGWEY